jgi:hypothetical protein
VQAHGDAAEQPHVHAVVASEVEQSLGFGHDVGEYCAHLRGRLYISPPGESSEANERYRNAG